MEENVLKMRSAKWFIKIHIYIEQTVIQIHLFYLLKYKFFIRILYNLWVTKQDKLLFGEGVNILTFREGGLNIGFRRILGGRKKFDEFFWGIFFSFYS